MAFDGITVAAVVQELEHTLVGGRISKIAQPENDELLLTIKGNEGQKRLYISASASLPLIYLTNENKPSPMTAPGFCMLLFLPDDCSSDTRMLLFLPALLLPGLT